MVYKAFGTPFAGTRPLRGRPLRNRFGLLTQIQQLRNASRFSAQILAQIAMLMVLGIVAVSENFVESRPLAEISAALFVT